ncbi:MAG: primosomal protein N', partial [Planctomycetota bacterium]|nr:primosomal protein N' [Planctomycetota bacterium]
APGQGVRVRFGRGNRSTVGFCVGLERPPGTLGKLKQIDSIVDAHPLVDATMLELTRWIAYRYLCGWGQVLESVIPAGVKRQAGTRMVRFFGLPGDFLQRLGDPGVESLPKKQQAVVAALNEAGRPMRFEELTRAAGCGNSPIESLRKKGFLETESRRIDPSESEASAGEVTREQDLTLNNDQRLALEKIVEHLRDQQHRTILLHGVTGSGKTEVYIQAIREVVAYGRQAIVLVPEISLTPQTIRRFRSRFDSVAVLHSHLGDAERHFHWQRIARGEVQVIVGARSAVFAPTPHLGLIVIDEEHETTFKQESTPRYHARAVARRRAELAGVPLVLGSATPMLESWLAAETGGDQLLSLPARIDDRPMPPVSLVDTRNDRRIRSGVAIGQALETFIKQALDDDGQAILFLNLRGHSPAVWCRACGQGMRCGACDVTLTWHRDRRAVVCHVCDYQAEPPSECPGCGKRGLKLLGVGTQKLEDEVRRRFPEAKVLRMDSDSMRRPGSHDRALEQFRSGEAQILLGTQMIAKGLDFPNVTLVGVVDADTMLHQPDIRASERTFQLIAQVAGRTGRSERGGRVLVQSACPDDPAIRLACEHDYASFVTHELAHRRATLTPPFTSLARVILRSPDELAVADVARGTAEVLRKAQPDPPAVRILGPAPAPISRVKNYYRFHLQLAAETPEAIRELWLSVVSDLPKHPSVESVIDVDPLNLR